MSEEFMTDPTNNETAEVQSSVATTSTFYLRIALISVALIVGLGVIGQYGINAASDSTAQIEPIASAVLLCPEPGIGAQAGSRMTAVVVPGQPGQDQGDGNVSITTLAGKVKVQAKLTSPGAQTEIAGGGRRLPAISVIGTGSLAPGLIANQWSRDPRGQGRGMASTPCDSAGSDFWFVGGGAVAGRQTRVVLVNPDSFAASIDLVIYGPNGVVDAPAGRGLVVSPKQRMYVRMDALAPGITTTAIHVIARTGRIGASVDDDQMSGLRSVGTEWVPRAAAPAKTVYVPGVFPGNGVRVLAIAAPGGADAQVSIRVITKDGAFQPAERDRVTVPNDSVVSLDMSSVTQGQPATLELTSDTPIVAGMRQFFGTKRQQNDTAYATGAQPLTTTAAVSGLPVQGATRVRVALTAPKGEAKVQVSLLPYLGKDQVSTPVQVQDVTIPAGTVVWLPLRLRQSAAWFTVVVTPQNSAPFLVAHEVLESSSFGDLVTGYPWQPLRTEVRVPAAHEDPGLSVRK
ncbi:MAG: hypothetical protein F2923_06365 [Actinobacteria bacterium]|uniref:Unannotated protein n=1 Tax=freshwater metagenome TaxID=449393 RepID=A0A6J7SL89_9ZZZZ|nr:hypothetical protein [Actinomycetota bacterium]MTB28248.1 hypothetical protein [Actinomycetota bacterium]